MDIQTEKIELAKKLLNTENIHIIDAIKSVFDSYDANIDWADIPDAVVADAEKSMRQVISGDGIPHEVARETYKKWL
jgi:hypothetical protein